MNRIVIATTEAEPHWLENVRNQWKRHCRIGKVKHKPPKGWIGITARNQPLNEILTLPSSGDVLAPHFVSWPRFMEEQVQDALLPRAFATKTYI